MRVLPFYTALGFLRIARLYDGSSYRDNLIREAMECLHSRV